MNIKSYFICRKKDNINKNGSVYTATWNAEQSIKIIDKPATNCVIRNIQIVNESENIANIVLYRTDSSENTYFPICKKLSSKQYVCLQSGYSILNADNSILIKSDQAQFSVVISVIQLA